MIICVIRKVKVFFHNFQKSLLPQPAYYRYVARSPFIQTLRYIIVLLFLLNIIIFVLGLYQFNPIKISNSVQTLITSLEKYPSNLVINIHNGSLLTTYNRPFLYWIDFGEKTRLLVVVDETATPEKINEYQSDILITSREFVLHNTQQKSKLLILPLSYLNDQTIRKESFDPIIFILTKIQGLFFVLYFLLFIGLFVFFFATSVLVTFFYVFLVHSMVFIIMKLFRHRKIRFKKTYQIALHSVTLPLVVDYGLNTFSFRNEYLPLLYLILSTIFIFGGIYEAYVDTDETTVKRKLH